jgi:DNA helicase-2/ATP-dependent DNA helicase PcrA
LSSSSALQQKLASVLYRAKFKHILVDEYQDTNPVQYKLLRLLTEADGNIFVVGDDWQSIYSWRGADYRIILNFEPDFPGAKIVKLEQNYRSTQNNLGCRPQNHY